MMVSLHYNNDSHARIQSLPETLFRCRAAQKKSFMSPLHHYCRFNTYGLRTNLTLNHPCGTTCRHAIVYYFSFPRQTFAFSYPIPSYRHLHSSHPTTIFTVHKVTVPWSSIIRVFDSIQLPCAKAASHFPTLYFPLVHSPSWDHPPLTHTLH